MVIPFRCRVRPKLIDTIDQFRPLHGNAHHHVGTIAHATLKAGHAKMDRVMADWKRDVRRRFGSLRRVGGQWGRCQHRRLHRPGAGRGDLLRKLAELPEQHEFYLRFNQVFEAEPTWEDVNMEWGVKE